MWQFGQAASSLLKNFEYTSEQHSVQQRGGDFRALCTEWSTSPAAGLYRLCYNQTLLHFPWGNKWFLTTLQAALPGDKELARSERARARDGYAPRTSTHAAIPGDKQAAEWTCTKWALHWLFKYGDNYTNVQTVSPARPMVLRSVVLSKSNRNTCVNYEKKRA